MKSYYDIYEYREITDKDVCARYENIGMLYPILTQFSPIKKIKWGMVWDFIESRLSWHKISKYSSFLHRTNCKCLPLTEEFYKRVLDITPMGAWR